MIGFVADKNLAQSYSPWLVFAASHHPKVFQVYEANYNWPTAFFGFQEDRTVFNFLLAFQQTNLHFQE